MYSEKGCLKAIFKMVISGITMNTGNTLNANRLKNEIIPQGTLATNTCKNGFCQYHW
jgi:hypothetical protein